MADQDDDSLCNLMNLRVLDTGSEGYFHLKKYGMLKLIKSVSCHWIWQASSAVIYGDSTFVGTRLKFYLETVNYCPLLT